jgi:hypothetical protein
MWEKSEGVSKLHPLLPCPWRCYNTDPQQRDCRPLWLGACTVPYVPMYRRMNVAWNQLQGLQAVYCVVSRESALKLVEQGARIFTSLLVVDDRKSMFSPLGVGHLPV